mmetsp:Transcript_29105/g.44423  ORF Transcript_29105/g.44423 Transcript_29105/m.44423 type:complete len:246 (-) Transcript_29105:22-759(-)
MKKFIQSIIVLIVTALIPWATSSALRNPEEKEVDVDVDIKTPDVKLIEACGSLRPDAKMDRVRQLISRAMEEGGDINTKFEDNGQTCLMAACLMGKINTVKYLLEELGTDVVDVTIGEFKGYTPPHGAAFQGRAEVMKVLIKAGVDVNQFHEDGYAPIHRACFGTKTRHAEAFQVLIDHGVDPELKTKNEELTCRQLTNNYDVLEILDDVKYGVYIESEYDDDKVATEEDDDESCVDEKDCAKKA